MLGGRVDERSKCGRRRKKKRRSVKKPWIYTDEKFPFLYVTKSCRLNFGGTYSQCMLYHQIFTVRIYHWAWKLLAYFWISRLYKTVGICHIGAKHSCQLTWLYFPTNIFTNTNGDILSVHVPKLRAPTFHANTTCLTSMSIGIGLNMSGFKAFIWV